MSTYDAYQQYPQIVHGFYHILLLFIYIWLVVETFVFQIEKLKELDEELSCGTGAAIAILKNNRLYVANVGECRVLLCKTDKDDVMRVIQPSVDHNLSNLDEVTRLENLGLKIADGKINGLNNLM